MVYDQFYISLTLFFSPVIWSHLNYSKESGQEFISTLIDFFNSDSVYNKEIIYRGEKRCIYIDKETGQGVLTKDGQFESGWKLTERQIKDVILRGRLS